MSNNYKIGDRVILTGKGIIPMRGWPVWGSEYECVGTITGTIGDITVIIKWDDGLSMSINSIFLSHFTGGIKETDPNIAFLHRKMEG